MKSQHILIIRRLIFLFACRVPTCRVHKQIVHVLEHYFEWKSFAAVSDAFSDMHLASKYPIRQLYTDW